MGNEIQWHDLDINLLPATDAAKILSKIIFEKKNLEQVLCYKGKKYRILKKNNASRVLQVADKPASSESRISSKTLPSPAEAEKTPVKKKKTRAFEYRALPIEEFLFGSFHTDRSYPILGSKISDGKEYLIVLDGCGEKYVLAKNRFRIIPVFTEPPFSEN